MKNDDVVDVLTRQHRRLEAQLKALLDSADDGATERLARAGDELAVHILAEEQLVYPAVHAARTEDILLESLEEHLSLKRLLADLLALDPADPTFTPKCKVLEEQARHHHQEEEEHLFPKMRRLLDAPALQAMGAAVRAHEQALRANEAPRERIAAQTEAAAPLA
jgi:hemerythrin superfamily protein